MAKLRMRAIILEELGGQVFFFSTCKWIFWENWDIEQCSTEFQFFLMSGDITRWVCKCQKYPAKIRIINAKDHKHKPVQNNMRPWHKFSIDLVEPLPVPGT